LREIRRGEGREGAGGGMRKERGSRRGKEGGREGCIFLHLHTKACKLGKELVLSQY
jgi:hypothetical protein